MAQPPPPGGPPGPYGPYGSGPFGSPPTQPQYPASPPYTQPGGYYPPPPGPQKSGGNAVWILVALGAFAVLSCGILGAVGFALSKREEARAEETSTPRKASERSEPASEPEPPKPSSILLDPFRARDGRSQIRPAVGWSELPELHAEASIEWGNKAAEEYLIVISEPRANFDSSLNVDSFANIHITRMRTVITNMELKGPKRLTLGGSPALQYEVFGSVDFVRIGYLISYVEGSKSFHQVLTWTLLAQFDDKKAKFAQVMDSFREI